jgi:Domain of unknown function (DUF4430)
MHRFKVGGDGKPVRPRRGPATVIGDASRFDASHWLTLVNREGAAGRPVSQETSRRPTPIALAERGGPMKQKKFLALCGAIAIVLSTTGAALAASSSSGPAVTVQIKSLTKTLFGPTSVNGEKGSITKGGTPKGICPGNTAAGALDAATKHRWTGKYYSSLKDIFVTSILGVKPKTPDFWSILVNGKTASKGICEIKLKHGQKLQFKVVK